MPGAPPHVKHSGAARLPEGGQTRTPPVGGTGKRRMTDAVHNDADSAASEPQRAMLDHLRQLLDDALISGRVTQGQIVIGCLSRP